LIKGVLRRRVREQLLEDVVVDVRESAKPISILGRRRPDDPYARSVGVLQLGSTGGGGEPLGLVAAEFQETVRAIHGGSDSVSQSRSNDPGAQIGDFGEVAVEVPHRRERLPTASPGQ